MADNSASIAKMARILSIIQIITGVLLLGFGIADRLVYIYDRDFWYYYDWTGHVYFGVWIGVWMLITGSLGIPGSGREWTRSRNDFAGVFMGFSITSAVFGGTMIICYSIGLAQVANYRKYRYGYYYYGYNDNYSGKLAILAIMLILGIVTFAIGIWAAICACGLKPCACCRQPQVDQPMYPYPAGAYFVTQPPGSVPLVAPMQAGGNIAVAQGFHLPMAPVPYSGAPGVQHLTVQGASPQGMATASPQRWEHQFQPGVEKPLPYGHEGYTAQHKDQTMV